MVTCGRCSFFCLCVHASIKYSGAQCLFAKVNYINLSSSTAVTHVKIISCGKQFETLRPCILSLQAQEFLDTVLSHKFVRLPRRMTSKLNDMTVTLYLCSDKRFALIFSFYFLKGT